MSTLAPAREGICRIPHELELLGYSRFRDKKYKQGWFYPETIRLQGDKSSFALPTEWQHFIANINTVQAYRWLANDTLQKGWSNFKRWPWVERLTMMGNNLRVIDMVGERAYIDSYSLKVGPPDLTKDFYDDCLIHQLWTANNKGEIAALPCGSTRMIVIGQNLWIDKKYLTFVKDSPAPNPYPKVMRVTAFPSLRIHELPLLSSPVLPKRAYWHTSVTVLDTASAGDNTWAKTADGWMAMYYGGQWFLE